MTGGKMKGKQGAIGIVVSQFNGEITGRMLEEAKRAAEKRGAKVLAVVSVPGAYEIPLAAKKLLARTDISAVAAVGAVITGETKHDEAIMHAICASLLAVSLEAGKPVGLGIIGPGD